MQHFFITTCLELFLLFCENTVKIDLFWLVLKASTPSQKSRRKRRDKKSDLLICGRVLIQCCVRASDCLGHPFSPMFQTKWKKSLRWFKMFLLSLQDATFWERCDKVRESRVGFFQHSAASVVFKKWLYWRIHAAEDEFPNWMIYFENTCYFWNESRT